MARFLVRDQSRSLRSSLQKTVRSRIPFSKNVRTSLTFEFTHRLLQRTSCACVPALENSKKEEPEKPPPVCTWCYADTHSPVRTTLVCAVVATFNAARVCLGGLLVQRRYVHKDNAIIRLRTTILYLYVDFYSNGQTEEADATNKPDEIDDEKADEKADEYVCSLPFDKKQISQPKTVRADLLRNPLNLQNHVCALRLRQSLAHQ